MLRQAGRKPREPRRAVNAPAWISYDGSFGVMRCMVANMSRTGAWLRVENALRLPASFTLNLQQGARDGRKCKIVWRTAETVGVQFIG